MQLNSNHFSPTVIILNRMLSPDSEMLFFLKCNISLAQHHLILIMIFSVQSKLCFLINICESKVQLLHHIANWCPFDSHFHKEYSCQVYGNYLASAIVHDISIPLSLSASRLTYLKIKRARHVYLCADTYVPTRWFSNPVPKYHKYPTYP